MTSQKLDEGWIRWCYSSSASFLRVGYVEKAWNHCCVVTLVWSFSPAWEAVQLTPWRGGRHDGAEGTISTKQYTCLHWTVNEAICLSEGQGFNWSWSFSWAGICGPWFCTLGNNNRGHLLTRSWHFLGRGQTYNPWTSLFWGPQLQRIFFQNLSFYRGLKRFYLPRFKWNCRCKVTRATRPRIPASHPARPNLLRMASTLWWLYTKWKGKWSNKMLATCDGFSLLLHNLAFGKVSEMNGHIWFVAISVL